MKALTIREPWATLIKDKVKKIETRSWKTNYRGELFIHAGTAKLTKKIYDNRELISLVKSSYSFGNVICKCKLIDCVYMTDEFIEELKKNNYQEYLCGVYEVGRYAWILDDVEVVNPFYVKGKLGIWNIDCDL